MPWSTESSTEWCEELFKLHRTERGNVSCQVTNLSHGFILDIIMLGQNHSGAIDEFDGGFKQHCLKFFFDWPTIIIILLTKQPITGQEMGLQGMITIKEKSASRITTTCGKAILNESLQGKSASSFLSHINMHGKMKCPCAHSTSPQF